MQYVEGRGGLLCPTGTVGGMYTAGEALCCFGISAAGIERRGRSPELAAVLGKARKKGGGSSLLLT